MRMSISSTAIRIVSRPNVRTTSNASNHTEDRSLHRWNRAGRSHRIQRTRIVVVLSYTRVSSDDRCNHSQFSLLQQRYQPSSKDCSHGGVGTILDAREVLILANGHNKANAVKQAIEGAVNQMWTVTALQLPPKGIIVCDEAACIELKVGTYNYFKDIEKNNL